MNYFSQKINQKIFVSILEGESMNDEIILPTSEYIHINLGLKYLNGNKKLYLKVLNSFLNRYEHFNIYDIEENEFENAMHILKGLASTLGMPFLSNLAQHLNKASKKELLLEFSEVLKVIITDLHSMHRKNHLVKY